MTSLEQLATKVASDFAAFRRVPSTEDQALISHAAATTAELMALVADRPPCLRTLWAHMRELTATADRLHTQLQTLEARRVYSPVAHDIVREAQDLICQLLLTLPVAGSA